MTEIDLEPPFIVIKAGVSEEEFYSWATEDTDAEYLDGRIVVHSPSSNRHEDLFRFLLTLFSVFLGERPVGAVRGSRYPMRLDARWSPEPDILVVLNEHRSRFTKSRLEGPADLVIEICSEGDPEFEYRVKLPRYREAGIPEIWIVDPFRRHVHTERKGEAPALRTTGRLESAAVPGFWIEVDWLWAEELPPTLPCVRKILGD